MNIVQLEKGNELIKIINTTKKGLKILKELREEKRIDSINHYNDGLYQLYISKYTDNSKGADLCRYLGNIELLDVIIATLEKQLKEFQNEFESL